MQHSAAGRQDQWRPLMKRMLTACKIYNKWPERYFLHFACFFFFPVASFSFSDRILSRTSLGLMLLGDFLQASCSKWVIEIIYKWQACSYKQQQQEKNCVVRLSRWFTECTVIKKALMFSFKYLDKENGAFVGDCLIITPANGCTCVNKVWIWMFVCLCVLASWTFVFNICLLSLIFSSCHLEPF